MVIFLMCAIIVGLILWQTNTNSVNKTKENIYRKELEKSETLRRIPKLNENYSKSKDTAQKIVRDFDFYIFKDSPYSIELSGNHEERKFKIKYGIIQENIFLSALIYEKDNNREIDGKSLRTEFPDTATEQELYNGFLKIIDDKPLIK